MTDPKDAQEAINDYIRKSLEPFQGIKGQFECEWVDESLVITLYGKKDGKTVYFWDQEPVLRQLTDAYRTAMEKTVNLAGFAIDADLKTGEFNYTHFPIPERDLQKEKEEAEAARITAQNLEQLKKKYQALSTKYGTDLAEKTVNALQSNALSFNHRDYCGMGLEKDSDGAYYYGEVNDGYLEPQLRFPDREKFVEWLSRQSDASLARLEKDSWYWGNQVISRQRLEEFVASAGPVK